MNESLHGRNKVTSELRIARDASQISAEQQVRDHIRSLVYIFAPLIGGAWSLFIGRHAGFDYLNRRWFLGWLFLRDMEDMPGALQRLAFSPYLNEIFIASLALIGQWWLGPLLLALLHSLICPLTYDICRTLCPDINRGYAVASAFFALSSPLAFVHLGRESGHLLAALFIVGAFHHLIRRESDPNLLWISVLLTAALAVKLSSVFTVAVSLIAIACVLPIRAAVKMCLQVAVSVICLVALSSIFLWRAGGVKYFSLGEIVYEPTKFLLYAGALLVVFAGLSRKFLRSTTEWRDQLTSRSRGLLLISLLIAMVFLTTRFTFWSDPAFTPGSTWVSVKRILSTGQFSSDVVLGPNSVRDLEYSYFDVTKRLSLFVAAAAILGAVLSPGRRTFVQSVARSIALVPGFALVCTMFAYGYVRYAVEAVVLVPLAFYVFVGTLRVGDGLRQGLILVGLGALVLPVAGVGAWDGYDDLSGRPGASALVDAEEREWLSGLIPPGSPVFLFGRLTTWVAPVVDRDDPNWFVKPVRPDDVGEQRAVLFYDLGSAADLDKFTTRGWSLSECQALRLRHVALGWCSLSVN